MSNGLVVDKSTHLLQRTDGRSHTSLQIMLITHNVHIPDHTIHWRFAANFEDAVRELCEVFDYNFKTR